MKNNIGKYIGIVLAIICLILVITLIYIKASSVSAKTSDKDLRDKIKEEISYLDSNITETMNKLNNVDVIKYKVYTKEVNDPSSKESNSEGQSGSNKGDSQSQNSSSQENSDSSGQGSSGQSSSNQGSSSRLII